MRTAERLRYDVNCSILFTELPLLERPAAARAAGFTAVEFWWPFPDALPTDGQVDEFVASIESAGVRLVGLNFFAGDMAAGDRGLVSWPGRVDEFRASVLTAVAIGQRLGCRAFNALYGNRLDGVDPRQQDAVAAENLAYAADVVVSAHGVVLVEPVSGADRYPLRTARDAVEVVDRVNQATGLDNCRLLADLYHLTVNGDDVPAALAAYSALVGHVQIADAPGRGEPGTGTLDLAGHLDQLTEAGYDGWVGLEYKPSTASGVSFGWLRPSQRAADLLEVADTTGAAR